MDEQHPLQARSPYAASKIGADKVAEAFHLAFGLPVVVVRPFNAFGPRQSARAIVPAIATQALTQPAVRLGNLEPTRDLTFVADTVDGFVRAAEAPGALGQVVNLGTGRETSVGDLARTIIRLVGRDVAVETDAARVRPVGSEVTRLCADVRRAESMLGWRAATRLEEGLARTVAWIEEHLDRFKPAVYGV
jgi:dTDP-glucose 4,6-dehydratase